MKDGLYIVVDILENTISTKLVEKTELNAKVLDKSEEKHYINPLLDFSVDKIGSLKDLLNKSIHKAIESAIKHSGSNHHIHKCQFNLHYPFYIVEKVDKKLATYEELENLTNQSKIKLEDVSKVCVNLSIDEIKFNGYSVSEFSRKNFKNVSTSISIFSANKNFLSLVRNSAENEKDVGVCNIDVAPKVASAYGELENKGSANIFIELGENFTTISKTHKTKLTESFTCKSVGCGTAGLYQKISSLSNTPQEVISSYLRLKKEELLSEEDSGSVEKAIAEYTGDWADQVMKEVHQFQNLNESTNNFIICKGELNKIFSIKDFKTLDPGSMLYASIMLK